MRGLKMTADVVPSPVAAALLIACLVLVACDSSTGPTPITMNLTAADNGKNLTMHPADVLVITLDSNVTTGFRWELSSRPVAKVLSLEDSRYVVPSTSPGVVGAGGQEVWRFRAVGEGTTTLELTYQRASGETSGRPFSITVRVTPT
jgi:Predicted secreted protein